VSILEVGLIHKGMTDIGDAFKNASLDLTGRGIGGVAAGKAGAAIGGMAAGPLGLVVGATVGAVAGAILGGKVASEIKRRPLEEARVAFEKAEADFRKEATLLEQKARSEFRRARTEEERSIRPSAASARADIVLEVNRLKQWREESEKVPADVVTWILDKADDELGKYREALEAKANALSFLEKWLWPSARSLGIEAAREALLGATMKVRALRAASGSARPIWRGDLSAALAQTGLARERVELLMQNHERARHTREEGAREVVAKCLRDLARLRVAALARLNQVAQKLAEDLSENLRPYVKVTTDRLDGVRAEAGKLGIGP